MSGAGTSLPGALLLGAAGSSSEPSTASQINCDDPTIYAPTMFLRTAYAASNFPSAMRLREGHRAQSILSGKRERVGAGDMNAKLCLQCCIDMGAQRRVADRVSPVHEPV